MKKRSSLASWIDLDEINGVVDDLTDPPPDPADALTSGAETIETRPPFAEPEAGVRPAEQGAPPQQVPAQNQEPTRTRASPTPPSPQPPLETSGSAARPSAPPSMPVPAVEKTLPAPPPPPWAAPAPVSPQPLAPRQAQKPARTTPGVRAPVPAATENPALSLSQRAALAAKLIPPAPDTTAPAGVAKIAAPPPVEGMSEEDRVRAQLARLRERAKGAAQAKRPENPGSFQDEPR